jgi:hypothetical protein
VKLAPLSDTHDFLSEKEIGRRRFGPPAEKLVVVILEGLRIFIFDVCLNRRMARSQNCGVWSRRIRGQGFLILDVFDLKLFNV